MTSLTWDERVTRYLGSRQAKAPEPERPRDDVDLPDRPHREPGDDSGVVIDHPRKLDVNLIENTQRFRPLWMKPWGERILLEDLPIVVHQPARLTGDPLPVGEFLLWPDPATEQVSFALTRPRLGAFSMTVERGLVDREIRTTGGTATLTVSVYPLDPPAALQQHRQAWTDALAAAGYGTRSWKLRPLDLQDLQATLQLPPEWLRGHVRTTTSPEAGTAMFLIPLSPLGALAWQQALTEGRPQLLQAVCRLDVKAYQRAEAGVAGLGSYRDLVLSGDLGTIVAGVGPEAVQLINPETSVEAVILVAGHPTVETVLLEMRTGDGEQVHSAVFGPEGGRLSLRLTATDLDAEHIDWTAQVVYKSTSWPAIKELGRLSSRGGWSQIVNPASWVHSVAFTAMLLDGGGQVVPAGSGTATDPANRVHGDLSFSAPFLSGSPLQTTFESSNQEHVTVYYPLPPGQPAAGQLKLTVLAVRDGRDDQVVRVLRPDETTALAKVYANARIEVFTNRDPVAERSDEEVALQLLDTLRRDPGPRPEAAAAPEIAGPATHSVAAGPPSFEVRPGDNPYWLVEVATRAELFDVERFGDLRDEANFHSSDAEAGGFSTGSGYTLPAAAWQRLRGATALYYRVWTSASEVGWADWAVSTPDGLAFAAPSVKLVAPASGADLSGLLAYLGVSAASFATEEDAYFRRLGELLAGNGVTQPGDPIDRGSFREAVRAFQQAAGMAADGIPGEDTLWALQADWAESRDLEVVRVDADVWLPPGQDDWDPARHGFDHFLLREDAARRYEDLWAEITAQGGLVTSAGAFRDVGAAVTAGRSTTSFHYSGLAFDLATPTGMQDPEVDPYLVTREGDRWRVWVRAEEGSDQELDAVVWRAGTETTRAVQARVVDFTAAAERHGFFPISPRSCFPGQYLCAEWWHFQCNPLLTPWISQFGIELLSLRRYSTGDLEAVPAIWANRKAIFRRGRNGWH